MNPRRRLPEEAKAEALNMTPMIDVVFQLLIFFMLSMNFRDVEGKLLSTLPRHGTASALPEELELREVRVKLRVEGRITRVQVEAHEAGELRPTETTAGAAVPNRKACREAAARVKALHAALPGDRTPPVILDAGPDVPYEHVLGILDACRAAGLDRIEFAARPPSR
jgi:biopolymer transport protein ExbD